ncbi:hypothetical protein HK102_013431 [Quaeritorhiza haematococci]|nr:hypothetical protein HK102_013431 [Quaeritorhiza haematococci]
MSERTGTSTPNTGTGTLPAPGENNTPTGPRPSQTSENPLPLTISTATTILTTTTTTTTNTPPPTSNTNPSPSTPEDEVRRRPHSKITQTTPLPSSPPPSQAPDIGADQVINFVPPPSPPTNNTIVTAPPRCVPLRDSGTYCDAWSNNWIDLTEAEQTYGLPVGSIKDIADYDDMLNKLVTSRRGPFSIELDLVCPGFTPQSAPGIRYASTFFCADDIIWFSAPGADGGCVENAPPKGKTPTPICPSVCTAMVNSVETFVRSHSSQCTVGTNQGALDLVLKDLRDTCMKFAADKGDGGEPCVQGVTRDLTTCGFDRPNLALAESYCSSTGVNDTCCSRLNNGITADSNLTASLSTSTFNLSSGAIAGIAIGICVILLSLGGLVVCLLGRSAKRKQELEETRRKINAFEGQLATLKRPATLVEAGLMKNGGHGPGIPVEDSSHPNSAFLSKYVVHMSYHAQLPDELTLNVGDVVVLETMYNDGWAFGRNETSGEQGALPVATLKLYQ